eukprot:TRINITY_DN1631_c1_g1_i3.p3 TRINITY_DN1631_c1_g1~~TRINITY_DN1631_c1_g1_i3.p3  ORF type:complete len:112 (-),score=12.91 TRINITY_DN1631_c1_g1_i3:240-575(-)
MELLQKDIERYQNKNSGAQQFNSYSSNLDQQQQQTNLLEKILIADFFVVIGIMLWLAVAVVAKTQFQNDELYQNWIILWPLIFQPAIGVLMLGAIVQGLIGYFSQRQKEQQ